VHELDRGRELEMPLALVAREPGGRLPPDEIRWFATSGIMVTSEPVRARIVSLTRAISALVSLTRGSTPASACFSSNATTTPKAAS
jgi:hypothetical protein